MSLFPSSMGMGCANSSVVRPKKRLIAARLMDRGREDSFVALLSAGCGVDTAGCGVDTAGDGVAATGDGAAAEAAFPLNYSCMAMMANLTPAGVMPWIAAISL